MTAVPSNPWVQFLRSYGPIPANDNVYDEGIQRALRRHRMRPIQLQAPYLDELLANLRSDLPISHVLTGTAGDGKTYLCRQVWLQLGGAAEQWIRGEHVQKLQLGNRELIFVKDLSELKAEVSTDLLQQMARDVINEDAKRIYIVAANHGQLLEKLKEASVDDGVRRIIAVVEELLHSGSNPDSAVRLKLKNLSLNPDTGLIQEVIDQIVDHPGWKDCDACPVRAAGNLCPIWENRRRLSKQNGSNILRTRLEALILISTLNDEHFPVRQLLILAANAILGHPAVKDRLMSCADVPKILAEDDIARASIYSNLFGENLPSRLAERRDVFRKLNAFGIGAETSNAADNLLVYGADDPELKQAYKDLVLNDSVYGGGDKFSRAQQAYLEGYESEAKSTFLRLLRSQRQRLFFTLPAKREADFDLWDLTVFRHAGRYLNIFTDVHLDRPVDRKGMSLLLRGLNRLFTGMLVQNEDQLVLATSGSLSQSKRSPLLDEIISVPRRQGEEVSLAKVQNRKIAVRVSFGRTSEPKPEMLELTPTRYEFLGRVAEGALPSSFSLECQEDLLAFKARLLAATERRRALDDDDGRAAGEIIFNFIKVGSEGTAEARRVAVKY